MHFASVSLVILFAGITASGEETAPPETQKDRWVEQLRETSIDVSFEDTSIADAVANIVEQCREKDDDGYGVPFYGTGILHESSTRIDWEREGISCADALYKIVSMDRFRLLAKDDGIHIIGPPTAAETRAKLESIVLPSVEFVDTPLQDALNFLQQRTVELDTAEHSQFIGIKPVPPETKGTSIVLDSPVQNTSSNPTHSKNSGGAQAPRARSDDEFGFAGGGAAAPAFGKDGTNDPRITLRLSNVNALNALETLCDVSGLRAVFEEGTVLIVPKPTPVSKGSKNVIYKKSK